MLNPDVPLMDQLVFIDGPIKTTQPSDDPNVVEIERRREEIKAGWNAKTRALRSVSQVRPLEVEVVSTRMIES